MWVMGSGSVRTGAKRSSPKGKRSSPKGKRREGSKGRQIQGRETQRGAAGEVGPREDVEDLVGTAADQVESGE
jgi:hypothetical protein